MAPVPEAKYRMRTQSESVYWSLATTWSLWLSAAKGSWWYNIWGDKWRHWPHAAEFPWPYVLVPCVSLTVCDILTFLLFYSYVSFSQQSLNLPWEKINNHIIWWTVHSVTQSAERMSAKISKDKSKGSSSGWGYSHMEQISRRAWESWNVLQCRPCSPVCKGSAPLPHTTLCCMSHYISSA